MGLDMYLNRVTFFSTHNRPEGVKIEVPGMTHIDPAKVQEIREQVGYWRKANQIHAWFVKYVQGGEDKCRPFSVSAEQLAELLALCKQIVAVKDNAKRQELYAAAANIIFRDDAAVAPIYWYGSQSVTKPWVVRTFSVGGQEYYDKWDINMAAKMSQ